MVKKLAVAGVAVFLCFAANQAFAGPHLNFGTYLNAAQCSPGPASKLVLNVVYQVANDADSGFGGYWAIDSYMKHVQVWDQADGTFCVIAKYNGSFVTVEGISPNNTGNVSAGVTGTMAGGYSAIITGGTFTPGTKRTKGNIGTKDYACTINSGVAVGCSYYNLFADYFPGAQVVLTEWGWIYHGGENGTWVNAGSGSSGDIIGQ